MELDMGVGGYFKTHDFAIEVWCSTAHALIYHRRSYISSRKMK